MEKSPILQLNHVTMRYGNNLVLDDVSIALHAGKAHCLLGYNGSGKSTLARIISGEEKPEQGELLLYGELQPHWNTNVAVTKGVVLVSGYTSVFPKETVLENMENSLLSEKGLFLPLTKRKWLRKKIDEFTQKYAIRCDHNTPMIELSNGDRVLLELLRVQLSGAQVVIVDEIDAVLGSRHKECIREILLQFKEEQKALLFISHKLDMVLDLADEVSLLQYSKLDILMEDKIENENMLADLIFSNSLEKTPRLYKNIGEQVLSIEYTAKNKKMALELYEGEILGIVGARTEDSPGLYNLLFGDKKDVVVRIRNRQIRKLKDEKAMAHGIVLMSANAIKLSTFSGYTVQRNMLPYNVLQRVHKEKRRNEICQRYINTLNIKATPSSIFDTLSLGHQRKVFIARSILSRGDIFIFDNPTDSIDSVSKIDIYNIINELKTRGKGIIFVSDDVQEVVSMSDRVIKMEGKAITKHYNVSGIDPKALIKELDPKA